jgi:hypothetical protein
MVTYKPVGIDENSEFPSRVETRLAEKIRDTMASALVAGSNVSITINDPSDTITINSSGGGGGSGGAGSATEDLSDPGFYVGASSADVEDPADPGTFISGTGLVTNVTSLPTASVSLRGALRLLQGATGVADSLHVCMKNSSNAYVWVQIKP